MSQDLNASKEVDVGADSGVGADTRSEHYIKIKSSWQMA